MQTRYPNPHPAMQQSFVQQQPGIPPGYTVVQTNQGPMVVPIQQQQPMMPQQYQYPQQVPQYPQQMPQYPQQMPQYPQQMPQQYPNQGQSQMPQQHFQQSQFQQQHNTMNQSRNEPPDTRFSVPNVSQPTQGKPSTLQETRPVTTSEPKVYITDSVVDQTNAPPNIQMVVNKNKVNIGAVIVNDAHAVVDCIHNLVESVFELAHDKQNINKVAYVQPGVISKKFYDIPESKELYDLFSDDVRHLYKTLRHKLDTVKNIPELIALEYVDSVFTDVVNDFLQSQPEKIGDIDSFSSDYNSTLRYLDGTNDVLSEVLVDEVERVLNQIRETLESPTSEEETINPTSFEMFTPSNLIYIKSHSAELGLKRAPDTYTITRIGDNGQDRILSVLRIANEQLPDVYQTNNSYYLVTMDRALFQLKRNKATSDWFIRSVY